MSTLCEQWEGCYSKGWKGLITDDSFKHPAKFGYGLIKRMVQHLFDLGVVRRGSLVADPFGGVGCGGIICAYNHLQWIGCELEQKFFDMAIENFKMHQQRWDNLKRPMPVILNGDSRRLSHIIKNHNIDAIISSPPFGQSDQRKPGIKNRRFGQSTTGYPEGNNAQLGQMKTQSVDAVISSPPFEGVVAFQDKAFRNKHGKMFNKTQAIEGTYGSGSAEQLGNKSGDTFWHAARDIVHECHKILKPKGVCIWVCKDYIKKGQRVPFSDDWQRLCLANGFKLRCRHKAMVVKTWKEGVLFGDDQKQKERKSFFRKLAERKGSPEINWEDIICCIKE